MSYIDKKTVIVLCLFFLFGASRAADVGWISGSVCGDNIDAPATEPDGLCAFDGEYCKIDETGDGQGAQVSDFGFTIPSTATVDSVWVKIISYNDADPLSSLVCRLGSDIATGRDGDGCIIPHLNEPTTDSCRVDINMKYTVTPSMVNDSTFGVDVYASSGNPEKGVTHYVDGMQLKIFYTLSVSFRRKIITVKGDQ